MKEKHILLIDDDQELGSLLGDYLGREGYALTHVETGDQGLAQAQEQSFELVLLDVMLPGMNGFDVLRELRQTTRVPVIMLTARGDEVDRIVGLEMGADDYLPKPFNPRELVARIKAVLRRAENVGHATKDRPPGEKIVQGDLTVEPEGFRAWLGETELVLTTIEFSLLRELIAGAGRVLTRDALLDRVRGREFEVFDRSIDVHISHLRQKLGDDPAKPRYIKTVRGVGYQFLEQGESA